MMIYAKCTISIVPLIGTIVVTIVVCSVKVHTGKLDSFNGELADRFFFLCFLGLFPAFCFRSASDTKEGH